MARIQKITARGCVSHMRERNDTRQTGRSPDLSARPLALSVIGMSFYWQLLRNANIDSLLKQISPVPLFDTIGWTWLYYGIALLVAACVAALSPRRHTAVPHARKHVTTLTVCLLATGVCLFGLATSSHVSPLTARAMSMTCATLLALSFVALSVGWAQACARMADRDRRVAASCICGSSLLSLVVSFALIAQGPVSTVICAFMPLASGGMLALLSRDAPAHTPPTPECLSAATKPARSWLLVLNIILLVTVVCLKGMLDMLQPPTGDAQLFLKHAITTAELVVIMAACLATIGLERFSFVGWIILTGGLVTGLGMIAFAASEMAQQFGLGTIAAARTCLEVFVFTIATVRAPGTTGTPALSPSRLRQTGQTTVRGSTLHILIVMVIPDMAACLLGYGILPLIFTATTIDTLPSLRAIAMALVVILAISAFLVMSSLALRGLDVEEGRARNSDRSDDRRDGGDTESEVGEEGTPRKSSSPHQLDALASLYALTPRERDVAEYVYRGYRAKRIAELMHLTPNTVQSHTRNLYRKMNIHSRQELIDLVDQE